MTAERVAFLIIDLVSEHQVENGLISEGHFISTVMHERGYGPQTKLEVVATKLKLLELARTSHRGAKLVHLAAHGAPDGLGVMGHDLDWPDVLHFLTHIVPPLKDHQTRVLILSCCYSRKAYTQLKDGLRKHFSGVYYLRDERVTFDVKIVVWTMFYGRKKLRRPLSNIGHKINDFFTKPRIAFRKLQ